MRVVGVRAAGAAVSAVRSADLARAPASCKRRPRQPHCRSRTISHSKHISEEGGIIVFCAGWEGVC